jgi:hypothetical protein
MGFKFWFEYQYKTCMGIDVASVSMIMELFWQCGILFALSHIKNDTCLATNFFAFILYAWIKRYHFKRMKYFYLYVVYKKWNLVRTTCFWDTLYQVSKHCYNVILYITSSIDAPYSYWQISQSIVVVFSNLFWRVAVKPLNNIVL